MKRFLLVTLLIGLVLFIVNAAWYASRFNWYKKKPAHTVAAVSSSSILTKKLHTKASLLKPYLAAHGFNTKVCFLVDMKIESGKNRFFMYNLDKDAAYDAGLVTHGRCNQNWLNGRKYDNSIGCGCTSLGKYKIGLPYKGRFGLAYKLYGLDATNSNAFNRFVVLHSHSCVPDAETDPYPICQSDGCPTVSSPFLKKLAATIDASPRPILLYIFE